MTFFFFWYLIRNRRKHGRFKVGYRKHTKTNQGVLVPKSRDDQEVPFAELMISMDACRTSLNGDDSPDSLCAITEKSLWALHVNPINSYRIPFFSVVGFFFPTMALHQSITSKYFAATFCCSNILCWQFYRQLLTIYFLPN